MTTGAQVERRRRPAMLEIARVRGNDELLAELADIWPDLSSDQRRCMTLIVYGFIDGWLKAGELEAAGLMPGLEATAPACVRWLRRHRAAWLHARQRVQRRRAA